MDVVGEGLRIAVFVASKSITRLVSAAGEVHGGGPRGQPATRSGGLSGSNRSVSSLCGSLASSTALIRRLGDVTGWSSRSSSRSPGLSAERPRCCEMDRGDLVRVHAPRVYPDHSQTLEQLGARASSEPGQSRRQACPGAGHQRGEAAAPASLIYRILGCLSPWPVRLGRDRVSTARDPRRPNRPV